jgi:hypothetical protein
VTLSLGLEPEENAIAAPVPLRPDFSAEALRGLAKGSGDPVQTRRLLVLTVIAAGGLCSKAAEIGGVGLQTVRDFRRSLQRRWPGQADRRQGPWCPSAPERRPARRPQGAGRTGADAGCSRGGALAAVRSAWILCEDHGVPVWRADAELRLAGDGLRQALRPPAPSRPGSGGCGCL